MARRARQQERHAPALGAGRAQGRGSMATQIESVATAFIADVRRLYAEEPDEAARWEAIAAGLGALLADPRLQEQAATWPDCAQGEGGNRAENLLFYEDPDYGFVIN